MAAPCRRSASACRAAAMLGALAALSACAAAPSDPPGGGKGLFRARISEVSGRVSPGPNSVWYVQREPVGFERLGVAAWRPRPAHPLRAWLGRLLGRRGGAESEPTALAAASLGLPMPSRVQVTNLVNGATLTVRVEDRTPMSGAIIRLSAEAARRLGANPAQPLLVRIRYLAPVVAYRPRPALRYAPHDRQPAPVRAPVAVAEAPAPITHAPAPSPAPLVHIAAAPTGPGGLQALGLALRPEQPVPRPAGRMLEVQAGAFANLDNARRAAARLRPVGAAAIAPMRRGEVTLYRVVVSAPGGAADAGRLRARVAEFGFADARLVAPL